MLTVTMEIVYNKKHMNIPAYALQSTGEIRCLVEWRLVFSADSSQCGTELNVSVKPL